MKKIQTKHANKMVDNKYYSTFKVSDLDKSFTEEELVKPGIIYAPYVSINIKTIVYDKNGSRTYWQIGRWMRFKLFLYRLFHRAKKI